MKMNRTEWLLLLALAGLALGGAGCVSFPVGREECVKTFEYRQKSEMTGETRREPVESAATARNEAPRGAWDAGQVLVGLEGKVRRTDKWEDEYRKVDLLWQKQLGFGFMPGVAGLLLRSDVAKAGVPTEGGGFRYDVPGDIDEVEGQGICLGNWLFIPYNLLVEPFAGSWDGTGHALCPRDWPTGQTRDPIRSSDWTRSDLYAQFAAYMEERLGRRTLFSACRDSVFFGFKRFSTYRWGEPREPRTAERDTAREEKAFGRGPFEVELEVPDIGWKTRQSVPPGAKEAAFSLPFADADRMAEGRVRFSGTRVKGMEDDATRALLEGARGKEYAVQVRLRRAPEGMEAAVAEGGRSGGEEAPVAVVTQVVARAAAGAPYRLEKAGTAENGAGTWRVTLLDGTKSGLEIAAEVRPKILAELREVYLARHPVADAGHVHAAVEYETAEGGAVLVFTGAAFELRPVVDGWEYDAATRRGSVRLHAPSDVPDGTLRRWAREHVADIVAEKNVARAVGSAPPPGAKFRLLDESLADGVLFLEFEAVE